MARRAHTLCPGNRAPARSRPDAEPLAASAGVGKVLARPVGTVLGRRLAQDAVCDTPLVDSRPAVGAVIALKSLTEAKTRLDAPTDLRQRIALSMFLDTAAAVSSVADQTVVISTQPGLADLLRQLQIEASVLADDPTNGLNPALQLGETWLRAAGADRILACVGDLPSLNPSAVRAVLSAADRAGEPQDADRRYFVSDAAGVGTTMLITDRSPLRPRFGGLSGRAHRDSGAEPLTAPTIADEAQLDHWARARRDVDTEEDLHAAYRLGLGRWTTSLIDPTTGTTGTFHTVTVAEPCGPSSTSTAAQVQAVESAIEGFACSVITESGSRLPLALAAFQGEGRRLRAGQRLHAVIGSGRVLTAW